MRRETVEVGMRCVVWGAGSFGTALAVRLVENGHEVCLWDRDPERALAMQTHHKNPRYLRNLELPPSLQATSDIVEATRACDLIVVAIPSHAMREVASRAREAVKSDALICCATKGLEADSLALMSDVLASVLGGASRIGVFSGPTFASELAAGLPTTAVVAGQGPAVRGIADAFHGGPLRVYHSDDLIGVCVGGALKNVIAIACGVSDGLALGHNARAAIITRGLREITRLAVTLGAKPETLSGLAGLGDLVLTCTGDASRNRRVGLAIGHGQSLAQILEALGEVAEGVLSAKTAWQLAQKLGVDAPIIEQVYAMLYEGRTAQDGLRALMLRDRRAEQG